VCNESGTPAGLEPLPAHVTITATNACSEVSRSFGWWKSKEYLYGITTRTLWWSRDSSVGVAKDYGLDDRGSILGRGKRFFSTSQLPDRLWGPPYHLYNGYRYGQRGRSVKLTTFWCRGQEWWGYTSNPQRVLMAWYLIKQRDSFTLPFMGTLQ
jgi:hypothetical protein